MEHAEAVEFIKTREINGSVKSLWADLGCGRGVFTFALADLIGDGSKIYALDKTKSLTSQKSNQVEIEFQQGNIETAISDLPLLDGILIANALHYIEDQATMIAKIKRQLKPNGVVILVEYDMVRSNQWVPYPVSFEKANELFSTAGFSSVTRIGERQSAFNRANMYSCVIR